MGIAFFIVLVLLLVSTIALLIALRRHFNEEIQQVKEVVERTERNKLVSQLYRTIDKSLTSIKPSGLILKWQCVFKVLFPGNEQNPCSINPITAKPEICKLGFTEGEAAQLIYARLERPDLLMPLLGAILSGVSDDKIWNTAFSVTP